MSDEKPKFGVIEGGKDKPPVEDVQPVTSTQDAEIEQRATALANQFAANILSAFSNRMLYLDAAIKIYGNMYITPGDEEDVIKVAQRIKHYVETGE